MTESGGFAGRVHSVRLLASGGRVYVEYRRHDAPPLAPPLTGSFDAERYVPLWRELEAARVWQVASSKPALGADLIHTELRVRLGDTTHVVGWNEGGDLPADVRAVAEITPRILAAGRGSASAR